MTVPPLDLGPQTRVIALLAEGVTDEQLGHATPCPEYAVYHLLGHLAQPHLAAAQGVLTPQPCVPVIASPWSPGSSVVTIQGVRALSDDSKCTCTWTGSIEITDPGTSVEAD